MRGVPLDKLYDESLDLLERARDQIANPPAGPDATVEPDRLALRALETTRLTALLTDCTAWVLLWLAIREGELERAEGFATENRLLTNPVLEDEATTGDLIDPALCELLGAARGLHRRLRGYERRMMDA